MNSNKITQNYVAFLRGINVGGHHKVSMADLQKELEKMDLKNIVTLLNSGNILFDVISEDEEKLEKTISIHLEKSFGFPIPTMIRKSEMIFELINYEPFKDIILTKDIRMYVSFLGNNTESLMELPWISEDNSYRIISKIDKTICSVLDLSLSKTPKAMKALEKYYGRDITTRNWNTIKRIEKKLEASR